MPAPRAPAPQRERGPREARCLVLKAFRPKFRPFFFIFKFLYGYFAIYFTVCVFYVGAASGRGRVSFQTLLGK